MKKVTVNHYDVFTKEKGKGNPAGVIFEADKYTTEEMQDISKIVGYNECSFICKSQKADMRLRYFTPGNELNLCGHGTVAAIMSIVERENIKSSRTFSVETLAGVIKVIYNHEKDEVIMEQANAEFIEFNGRISDLASAIGLTEDEIDTRYPIVYGSTGSWTLILPIKNLESFYKMIPNNSMFPSILKQNSYASVHPITLECINDNNTLHGRHFSSYYSGTIEDSVTGTASGVMGAYYIKYIEKVYSADIFVEQGNEIGKDGLVHVWSQKKEDCIMVKIAGQAVKTGEFEIELL